MCDGECACADTLEFKYLLKPKHDKESYILEDGANRVLTGGRMDGDAPPIASFKLPILDPLEFPVTIKADPVSPFTLAASWRLHMENLQSHGTMVRGIPDVSISGVSATLPARKVLIILPLFFPLHSPTISCPPSPPSISTLSVLSIYLSCTFVRLSQHLIVRETPTCANSSERVRHLLC